MDLHWGHGVVGGEIYVLLSSSGNMLERIQDILLGLTKTIRFTWFPYSYGPTLVLPM
jgi:hypothetical protein